MADSELAPDLAPLPEPALVISECQLGVLEPGGSVVPGVAEQAAERGIVQRIAALADAFRRAGRPVVHCTVAHRPDMVGVERNSLPSVLALKHRRMVAGTRDVEVPEPLAPRPQDVVSCRSFGLTAFYGTELDAVLRQRGIRTIVLTGVSTNIALPGLAMEAVNRGYRVVIPEDCTAGASAETHAFMVANLLPVVARISRAAEVSARIRPAAAGASAAATAVSADGGGNR
jgi:nicotinamidase-related amidase